jgi:cytoskeleton protein RodZ
MIEEEEQQQAVIQGPGQILKQARERANLSSQDIADKMKLKKALIEDIEQDNYDINISLTFIRGYLKLYAKHVQVGEEEILNAFESLSTKNKEPAKLQSFSRRVAHQANDDKLMLVTYLIVAAVIALVVIWWFQQSSTDTTTTSNVSNYPETVTQEGVAQTLLSPEETLTPDTDSVTSEPIVQDLPIEGSDVTTPDVQLPLIIEEQVIDNQSSDPEVVDNTNNLSVETNDIETTITETAAPVELIFEFSGDCWMNLADATGENIAYGVKVAGRVMPVTGIPPFVITLGAPEVVKISYAGESIDMSFLPSGRIAKFDLPLSE